jgi:uncharacterized membrane protein
MNRQGNTKLSIAIAAASVSALLMYLFDPDKGRRRIALTRDQAVRLIRTGYEMADAAVRDLAHRVAGSFAQARGALRDESPDDSVLGERVRARLGRVVSHPHAVKVTAASGCVTLTGPILKREERALLRHVRSVPGVWEVENRLEVHETAGNVPSLQGGSGRLLPRIEFMQESWAPGPRLVAFGAGVALAAYGIGRRDLAGVLLGVTGVGLATRAATNQNVGRMLGISGGRRVVNIEKSIHIAAPREKVFDLWSNYENFPRFMSLVEEVRRIDETRSHWVVKGPAGTHVKWVSVITERIRPEVLAWRSELDSPVPHVGIVRFDEANGGTRVLVRMSYDPPGGALGHTIATLLRRDPKHDLDADLLRMKAFIETGVAPRDATQPASVARQSGEQRAVDLTAPG